MKKNIKKNTQESEGKRMNEIIIDGVNVTECEHLTEVENTYCCDAQYAKYSKYSVCVYDSNCYYKTLKRLQEKFDTLANKFLDSEKDKYRLQEENMNMKKFFVDIISNIRKENYRYYKALKEADELFEVLENIMPSIALPEGNASPRAIKEARNKINEALKDERA